MKVVIPKFKTLHQLVTGILITWVISFFIHERFLPFYYAAKCNWTDVASHEQPTKEAGSFHQDQYYDDDKDDLITNVLFIADPQLIDNHTYPGRNSVLLKVSQHTADVYLKKNYRSFVNHLNPDYIFFLGDYLDNGRSSSDEYFKKEYRRFKSIFPHRKYGFKKDKNYFINLPGNHDIGIGDGVKLKNRKRFQKAFGKVNTITSINGVDIISLDTLSLMSKEENINKATKEFLDTNFGDSILKTTPRILLSHVPLFRDMAAKNCGPLRESPEFKLTKGHQYQSVVDGDISNDLLKRIKPDLVFSGDDHDYCDISHSDETREITVKSMSMAMGIWHPGVQLLSFNTRSEKFDYDTKMCYLPTPYYNIAHYVVLSVISGLVLLYWNFHQSQRFSYSILPLTSMTTKKLSNFVQDRDNDDSSGYNYIPNYTHTKEEYTTGLRKWMGSMSQTIAKLKRVHFGSFLRQIIALGMVVCLIYMIFCWTI